MKLQNFEFKNYLNHYLKRSDHFLGTLKFLHTVSVSSSDSLVIGFRCMFYKWVYRSGAPEFTSGFSGVRVTRSLIFYIVFCTSLFVLFLLAIRLSVVRFKLIIASVISGGFRGGRAGRAPPLKFAKQMLYNVN
jgi:hypothetical protein